MVGDSIWVVWTLGSTLVPMPWWWYGSGRAGHDQLFEFDGLSWGFVPIALLIWAWVKQRRNLARMED